MGDKLKKVRPGEPLRIPAATFNCFIDAARDFANRTHRMGAGALARAPGLDTGEILVRNDSGADVERFGILGVDTIVISPTDNPDEFKNRPILSVIAPAVPAHSENFVVLAEPLAHQATEADRPIGRAVIDGLTPVQVDVQNAGHGFAVVVNAQSTKLQSATKGPAQIIWKEAGTGDKWAVVRIGNKYSDLVVEYGQPDAEPNTDTETLLLNVVTIDTDGVPHDTGEDVSIFGRADRSVTPWTQYGWDTDTILTWVRFVERVKIAGPAYVDGVLAGFDSAPDELPSTSGKSQYMALTLGVAPGLAPGWDWVRAH